MPSVSQAHPTPAGEERRKKKNQFKWNLRYQYSNIFFFFSIKPVEYFKNQITNYFAYFL